MTIRIRSLIALTLVALMLPLGAAAWGGQPAPLPQFSLTNTDGQPVDSSSLGASGHWLLVYAMPNAGGTHGLLKMFTKKGLEVESFSNVIIVVSTADAGVVADLKEKFPELAEATWLMDGEWNMANAMGLRRFPVILALQDGKVEWDIIGVLGSIANQKTIISSWLKKK